MIIVTKWLIKEVKKTGFFTADYMKHYDSFKDTKTGFDQFSAHYRTS